MLGPIWPHPYSISKRWRKHNIRYGKTMFRTRFRSCSSRYQDNSIYKSHHHTMSCWIEDHSSQYQDMCTFYSYIAVRSPTRSTPQRKETDSRKDASNTKVQFRSPAFDSSTDVEMPRFNLLQNVLNVLIENVRFGAALNRCHAALAWSENEFLPEPTFA